MHQPITVARVVLTMTAASLAALLIGCSDSAAPSRAYHEDIPGSALTAREGSGRIFWQATDDGVIYVYDVDATKLLMSAPIKKNERFVLEPRSYRATVEGRTVSEAPFDRAHTRRIYFDPFGKAAKPASKPA